MSSFFKGRADSLSKQAYIQLRGSINCFFALLIYGEKTVKQLSQFLNNLNIYDSNPDVYYLIEVLENWGYIILVRDKEKYQSKIFRCKITEEGKKEISAFLTCIDEILSTLVEVKNTIKNYGNWI